MSDHRLAGQHSVEASARLVRNYRYAEERLMRVMAGWIALTPELPAKLVLGRHVWDCAQHADAWGRRLPELRAPAQQSEPPNGTAVAFFDLLESVDGRGQTVERLTGVYRVLKPHLAAVYAAHLAKANAVYEPPTRRILERCLSEERRHVAAGTTVLARLVSGPGGQRRGDEWCDRLAQALHAARGVTGEETELTLEAPTNGGDARRDLVALDSAFDPARVPADLARAVAAHYGDGEVVAIARIGEYRLVKVRRIAATGASILQSQWRRAGDEWRIVSDDVVRTDPG